MYHSIATETTDDATVVGAGPATVLPVRMAGTAPRHAGPCPTGKGGSAAATLGGSTPAGSQGEVTSR